MLFCPANGPCLPHLNACECRRGTLDATFTSREVLRPRVIVSAIFVFAIAAHVRAGDIFVSEAADGSTRYSTQALDPSYRLAFGEAAVQPRPAPAPTRGQHPAFAHLRPIIDRVSRRHEVSRELVEALISVESSFNPQALSAKGAQGLMQLMPATGARYGLRTPHDFQDSERNIDAGVRHLKTLLVEYGGNVALALAAYNAGAGAVARHRGRIPPYRETMLYVPAVLARSANATAAAIAP